MDGYGFYQMVWNGVDHKMLPHEGLYFKRKMALVDPLVSTSAWCSRVLEYHIFLVQSESLSGECSVEHIVIYEISILDLEILYFLLWYVQSITQN